jgi:predicted transcriptional regulator
MPRKGRPLTMRLDEDLIGRVEAIAFVEDTTLTALVTEALTDLVDRRVGSVEFQRRRDEALTKHREMLERLS